MKSIHLQLGPNPHRIIERLLLKYRFTSCLALHHLDRIPCRPRRRPRLRWIHHSVSSVARCSADMSSTLPTAATIPNAGTVLGFDCLATFPSWFRVSPWSFTLDSKQTSLISAPRFNFVDGQAHCEPCHTKLFAQRCAKCMILLSPCPFLRSFFFPPFSNSFLRSFTFSQLRSLPPSSLYRVSIMFHRFLCCVSILFFAPPTLTSLPLAHRNCIRILARS